MGLLLGRWQSVSAMLCAVHAADANRAPLMLEGSRELLACCASSAPIRQLLDRAAPLHNTTSGQHW
jgi:hypothetical protein